MELFENMAEIWEVTWIPFFIFMSWIIFQMHKERLSNNTIITVWGGGGFRELAWILFTGWRAPFMLLSVHMGALAWSGGKLSLWVSSKWGGKSDTHITDWYQPMCCTMRDWGSGWRTLHEDPYKWIYTAPLCSFERITTYSGLSMELLVLFRLYLCPFFTGVIVCPCSGVQCTARG